MKLGMLLVHNKALLPSKFYPNRITGRVLKKFRNMAMEILLILGGKIRYDFTTTLAQENGRS